MNNYIIIFFALICWQCKTDKSSVDQTIALSFKVGEKYPSVTESEYEFLYNFIPLETTEECLLGKIFCVKKYKGYLYIHSIFNKSIMIFSADGKFIKKIPIGRGPGEVIDPLYIAIDEQSDQLEVLDFFKQIKKYTLEGDYVGLQNCNMSSAFERIKGNYLFSSISAQNQKYCFEVQNTENKTTSFVEYNKIEKPPLMAYSQLFKTDSIIYFHTDFNHTVFFISENDLTPKPYATIVNQCTAEKIRSMSKEKIDVFCTNQHLYINMLNFNVLHQGHTIYAELITENTVEVFLYNIDNCTTYRVDNGLDGCIVGSYKNNQFKYITPSSIDYYLKKENVLKNKILHEKLIQISSVVEEEDNPIIIEIEIRKRS